MKAIYDSAWHHPFAAYVAGLVLLFAIARRLPFLYAYLVVFLVEILADAVATGAWSPITEDGAPSLRQPWGVAQGWTGREVLVFRRVDGRWGLEQRLAKPTPNAAEFGHAVALRPEERRQPLDLAVAAGPARSFGVARRCRPSSMAGRDLCARNSAAGADGRRPHG